MSAVLGASLGVSGIRTVSTDLTVYPPRSSESKVQIPESSADPWGSVTWAVHRFARESIGTDATPVLALREKNPTEAYGVEHYDGLALVSDLGAQIGALQEAGELAGEQTVALFDVGAGGVTVSIVDRETGHVHGSRRSAVFSGDGCDAALSTFLMDNYGLGRALEETARDLLVETVCSAKERLSTLTAVEIAGPFISGGVVLYRSQLDELVRESVYDAVTLAASMIADVPRVDAVFAVGGGANMQIVRQSLIDGLSVPVFVPREPELLAARGAAGMARDFARSTVPATAPAVRPRHSDTSSRRLTRIRGSRYLGGAMVALVAGGVGVSIAAASSSDTDPTPGIVYSPVITSSQAEVSPSAPTVAPSPTPLPVTTTTEAPESTESESGSTSQSTSANVPTSDSARTDRRRNETTTTASPDPTTSTKPTRTKDTDSASPTNPTSPSIPTTSKAPPTTSQAPTTSKPASATNSPTRTRSTSHPG
ncbi:Hsp70 family protein [Rhodococcus sovatensis]|uniref:Hsp70 family protein n=1 Tax=Rhodococcus sovatensis TaxID=1805840 RepID=A0ABZ2PPM2_9NOCA